MTELTEIPATCPHCGRETEIAELAPPFSGALAKWWIFKNGSRVICGGDHPTPRKCAPCDRGWVVAPDSGKILTVPRL